MLHTLPNPNYFCPYSPLPQYLQGIIHSCMRAQPAPSRCRRQGEESGSPAPPTPCRCKRQDKVRGSGQPPSGVKKAHPGIPGIGSSPEQSKIKPKAIFMQRNSIVLRTRKGTHCSKASRLERPSVGLGIKIDVGDARMPWQNCVY